MANRQESGETEPNVWIFKDRQYISCIAMTSIYLAPGVQKDLNSILTSDDNLFWLFLNRQWSEENIFVVLIQIWKFWTYLIKAATSSAVFHLANWPRRFWPAQTEVWIIFKKSCPVRGLKMKMAPLIGLNDFKIIF